MATLKDFAKTMNVEKAKERMEKILGQARDSVKALDQLQKEGLTVAKTIMDSQVGPKAKATKEKLTKNLGKLGLATRQEIKDLEKRLQELSSEVKETLGKLKK